MIKTRKFCWKLLHFESSKIDPNTKVAIKIGIGNKQIYLKQISPWPIENFHLISLSLGWAGHVVTMEEGRSAFQNFNR